MHANSHRWKAITPSDFPWEREALEYVREGLPDHEPYRVWSNFEFVADDGSINEVDLLVLAPSGLHLIEIKSHQGAVRGDAGTWTWKFDGKETVVDNPLLLTNRKAKRLKSLLQRQAATKKFRLPFLEAVVFLSATNLHFELDRSGRQSVWVRDDKTDETDPDAPPGILAALKRANKRSTITSKTARALTRAMDQAGVRRSQKARKVGDYRLDELFFDGDTYQDWIAHHASLEDLRRRIRIYGVSDKTGASREMITRAAHREFQILEGIQHPGILRPLELKEHELGPALIFDYLPKAVRLDHYLKQEGEQVSFDTRLHLFRQLAEILQVAHEKRLYHRVLSPQSVLVLDPENAHPKLAIFNWQTGVRESSSTTTGRTVSGTCHPDQLVESLSTAYMAPEVRLDVNPDGGQADVFSLGAIGYHLFAGEPPADSGLGLHKRLQDSEDNFGLRLSSAVDGVSGALDEVIAFSTSPRPLDRLSSIEEVLDELEAVEEELTDPDGGAVPDPDQATAGDRLEGGFRVVKRIGQGSTSLAFLVERGGDERVLKLARDADQNELLRNEAEVLKDLHHSNIVRFFGSVRLYGRTGLLLAPIGLDRKREDRTPRTLAERLRQDGPLSADLLERFGEHLLLAVKHLEERGIAHRDIKPDNLGIQPMGPNDALHLVLFDFSLSRAPLENLHVGTRPYLEPFLEKRPQKRWDLAAERFAVAVTLHEMATGLQPIWGDGQTAPLFTEGEAKIASDRLPTGLRQPLAEFFSQALKRDPGERFDNADEMYRAWMRAFEAADQPALAEQRTDEKEMADYVQQATLESQVIELGLSTRAIHALERLKVDSVRELLSTPLARVTHQPGVGNKTRKEVLHCVRALRKRFPEIEVAPEIPAEPSAEEAAGADSPASVDRLVQAVLPPRAREADETDPRAIRLYLGLDEEPAIPWCTQIRIAEHLGVTRARISQVVGKHRERWVRLPVVTALRDQIVEILEGEGAVMTSAELERAVLAARGSSHEGELRIRSARAATRAALEVERTLDSPRWIERRSGDLLLVAAEPSETRVRPSAQDLAQYAKNLGARADQLAAREPLPSPAIVIQELQQVVRPEGASPLPHARTVQLAAAASREAAASPRLELYPRGLAPSRALALSAGTLLGSKTLTPEALRKRVQARFPEAEPLPGRPALDELLRDSGLDLTWSPDSEGRGTYLVPGASTDWSSSGSFTRITSTYRSARPEKASQARDFERRLQRAHEEGRFFLLIVENRKNLAAAQRELCDRLDLREVDFDRLLVDSLRRTAVELGVDWKLVLAADADDRESKDWRNLQRLLEQTLPKIEAELLSYRATVLLTNIGLLARYDRLDFLERFRDAVGRDREAPEGLWILIPGDAQTHQPRLDGKMIPTVTPGEYTRIPPSWPSTLNRPPDPAPQEISA